MKKVIYFLLAILIVVFAVGPARADVNQDFQKGVNALKNGDYISCQNTFDSIIRSGILNSYPQDLAKCYLMRAQCYAENMKFLEADQDLEKAMELAPNDPVYIINRGAFLASLRDYSGCIKLMDAAERLGDRQAAMLRDKCKERQAKDEANGETGDPAALVYLSMAEKELSKRRYKSAMICLDQALRTDPKIWGIYIKRAKLKAHDHFNDPQGAIADLDKSIQLHANNPRAYMLKAVILMKDNPKEAIANAKQAQKLGDPDAEGLMANISTMATVMGTLDKSQAQVDKKKKHQIEKYPDGQDLTGKLTPDTIKNYRYFLIAQTDGIKGRKIDISCETDVYNELYKYVIQNGGESEPIWHDDRLKALAAGAIAGVLTSQLTVKKVSASLPGYRIFGHN